MIFYSYETNKIIIHNIHNEKEIEIEYLRLIFYCVNILKSSFTWYLGCIVMVPRGIRPVRIQNADYLNYMIFLHAYYAMEFCHFPYLYRSYIRTHYTIHISSNNY